MSAINDEKLGKDALVYFHNRALRYPNNYRMSFEELIRYYQEKSHGVFLDGFGSAIRFSGISEGKVQAAMERVADEGQGKLPSRYMDFFNALSNEASKINYVDMVLSVAEDSAHDLAIGAAEVGNVTLSTLKSTAVMLPFAIIGGILLFAYVKGRA